MVLIDDTKRTMMHGLPPLWDENIQSLGRGGHPWLGLAGHYQCEESLAQGTACGSSPSPSPSLQFATVFVLPKFYS